MKRLLLVALMVLVSLVGTVGVSGAVDKEIQTVITQLQDIKQTLSAISNTVSALQARANPATGAVTELQATVNDGVQGKPMMYYLTKNSFDGGDAITACDSGFHMASISEIQDPSHLQYAMSNSSAYVPARDEGSEPPAALDGWVRTGLPSAGPDPFSRSDDCDLYTTRSIVVSGTTVHLLSLWDVDAPNTNPDPVRWWLSSATTCASNLRVWCAEDPE